MVGSQCKWLVLCLTYWVLDWGERFGFCHLLCGPCGQIQVCMSSSQIILNYLELRVVIVHAVNVGSKVTFTVAPSCDSKESVHERDTWSLCLCQGFGHDEPESPFSSGGVTLAVLREGFGHFESSC